MNKDELDDLKQFILSVVSQSESRLGGRIDGVESRFDNLESRFDKLEKKMDDGFAGIGEAIDNLSGLFESGHKNQEKRIIKLEHKAA